jgi:RsmE family RNA methyltransferase
VNILLFSASERSGNEVCLTGPRLRHLREVQGLGTGSRLRVGELHGLLGHGEIVRMDAHEARLEVVLDTPPPPRLPLIVVLALPRPKMLRRILRTLAETGVQSLHLIHSEAVQKSYWQSDLLRTATLDGYLRSGLEQVRDTRPPEVSLHRRFRPFAEDLLPTLCAGRRALIAQPGAPTPCPAGTGAPALLMLGPEGGYSAFELQLATAAGCLPVSLGARVLRVETALGCALGRLMPCATHRIPRRPVA